MKLLSKALHIPVLLIIVMFAGFWGLQSAGIWLLVRDTVPESVDIIFTFAGDGKRVAYSKELMEQFRDSHWLLSDFKNGYATLLRKSGYEMSRVTTVDTCSNTISEIHTLFNYLERNSDMLPKVPVVALISSPYHMRRIQLMIHYQKKLKHVKFKYLPVPLERYNSSKEMYRKWWKYSVISDIVFSEFPKIIYFYIFQ